MRRSVGTVEADLVVLAAREDAPEPVLEAMRECIARGPDVRRFVRLAACHKVYSLALDAFSNLDAETPFVAEAVEQLTVLHARRWLRRRKRLARCMEVVRRVARGVDTPFCFMRGIAFAERCYRKPALRVAVDVDLLIPADAREGMMAGLRDAGFTSRDGGLLTEARTLTEGKTEMVLPSQGVGVDVNWRLTANLGIGIVDTDADKLWERAVDMGDGEFHLSPEDEFVTMVRHIAHGHDFEQGFLQCCADMAALFRTYGHELDWDYVQDAASKSECLRGTHFFAHFHDAHYRDEDMTAMLPLLKGSPPCTTPFECRLFARFIQAPLVRRKLNPKTTTEFVNGNLSFIGKFWSLDSLSRLARTLAVLPWPSRHLLIMLTLESHIECMWLRRIRYYFNPLLPGLPGVFIGTAVRLAVALSRGVRRPLRGLFPGDQPPTRPTPGN